MQLIERQRQLGGALVGYLIATIGVITLVPFTFRLPARLTLTGFTTLSDLVQNIILFVPLGFFAGFAGRRPLVVGAMVSLTVEVAQQFIPGRFPSLLDLATNSLGAALGGICYHAVNAAIGRTGQTFGVRALDLPLLGSTYLLVPLVWLSSLASTYDPGRAWLTALPLLAGAVVLGAVDRHYFRVIGCPRHLGPSVASGWAAVAVVPGWYRSPWVVIASVGMTTLLTALFSALVASSETVGRRYEIPTVRRALVPLVVFIGILSLWPVSEFGSSWTAAIGWTRSAVALGQGGLLAILELMAGATVAGFAIAEARGRAVESSARTRGVLLLFGGGLATAVEGVRGFHPQHGASLLEGLLLMAATGFGGSLYRHQRAFVIAALGRVSIGATMADQGRMVPPFPALGAPKWR